MEIKSARSFTQNFLILFTGNSIGQAIPFILAPFISRLYKPEEIAVQENFLAMASLIAIVAAARFDLAILIPLTKRKQNRCLVYHSSLQPLLVYYRFQHYSFRNT